MIDMSIFSVTKVELCRTYLGNGGSRTIRITGRDGEQEITLYGNTEVLDALPKSDDFRAATAARAA